MMTPLKTGYLLFLAAFLFLSAVPTVAEVVKSVADCKGFLLDEKSPQVPGILVGGNILNQNRYKPICQTYQDQRRFLTLYDIKNKIPVFSAYKYIKEQDNTKRANWKIEPQLENIDDKNKNMVDGEKGKTYNNQAGDIDYLTIAGDRGLNRGHLFPYSHASNPSDKESTMTLTNIVPQVIKFNSGSWEKMETDIRCVMKTFCVNNNNEIEGFVVTGAQPSSNNKLNNRVNIPSVLWSAFCCYNSKNNRWIASAHWGDNVADGPKYLQSQTLADLSNELGGINPFPGTQCPLHETLDDYLKTKITQTYSECRSTSGSLTSTSGPLYLILTHLLAIHIYIW